MAATDSLVGMTEPCDAGLPLRQRALLEATPDCIKLLSIDGNVLMINRAGQGALGLPEYPAPGTKWLPLLAEDVRGPGGDALERAQAGDVARFAGKSGSGDATVHWDNLLIPVVEDGVVRSIMCMSRDVTETVLLERQLTASLERERLLSREMRHRIKNFFAMVSGLIFMAQREARTADAPDSGIDRLRGKLDALARASDAAFPDEAAGHPDERFADLASVVSSVLEPYGGNCLIGSADVTIRRDATSTIALCLHELATNAIKYGALKGDTGTVAIMWTSDGDTLHLRWSESGGPVLPATPPRRGFGSDMIDRMLRTGGGSITRNWLPGGLVVEIAIPNAVQR